VWGNRDFVEGRWRPSVNVFVLLTEGTSLDVFFYPGLHGWPPGDA
jgi:hypothetical protein